MVEASGVNVFNVVGCGDKRATLGVDMNENSNPTSVSLGVVVMGIVPIVLYFVAVLVLPWFMRGFH